MKRIRDLWDFDLFILLILISLFGLMMVYSSSFTYAILEYDDATYFLKRQAIWMVFGLVLFFITSFIPYKLYGKYILPLLGIMLLLLILVLVPQIGVERNFARRWIDIGPMLFQPSELAKLVMIIYFAKVYTNKQDKIESFSRGLLPPLIILAFTFILVAMQPDFGTALSLLVGCSAILFISGAKWQHLVGLFSVAIIGIVMFGFTASYRIERMTSFLDPFADPAGDGFQLINSFIAISSGGFSGVGLGNSVQKLGYLPEAHTDFIMSIIVEELGIFGLIPVIAFYILLLLKGFDVFKKSPNYFGKLLAFGITIFISFQALLNLASVAGFMPITGITLPFISYGGTSLFIMFVCMGILMNISMHTTNYKLKQEQQMT